ncbi:hypothetical protein, partial [Lentzea tibetensis]|uniref:hypothetical protein n=1 Tax=Lentzea tibetensis TaxID=2591470 RepID=UPI0016495557
RPVAQRRLHPHQRLTFDLHPGRTVVPQLTLDVLTGRTRLHHTQHTWVTQHTWLAGITQHARFAQLAWVTDFAWITEFAVRELAVGLPVEFTLWFAVGISRRAVVSERTLARISVLQRPVGSDALAVRRQRTQPIPRA